MDEANIREIARGHGWPEDEFLNNFKRLVESYAYTPEGALAQAQRVFARKFGVKTKPEKKVNPQTESRLRKIAHTQGYDGDAFMGEYWRLISEGQSDQDALSQTMKLFEKSVKVAKRPTLATFAPGHLDEPSPTAGLGAPPGERPAPPKPKTGKSGIAVGPKGPPRTIEEVGNDDAGPRIDPELRSWLVGRGFVRGPEGVAYTTTDKVGEDTVKLQIDFSDDVRGMRYGYRLNISEDPPKWKPDRALRDHPTLLEYKRFRDDLLVQQERAKTAPPPASKAEPTEIPTGGGQVLMQKEAEEMEAKDDTQILAEMKGEFKAEVLKQLFYSFKSGERTITGLSYKGVKQIALRQGHIKVKELELKETEKAWIATCKARDKAKDLEVYGAAILDKMERNRNRPRKHGRGNF